MKNPTVIAEVGCNHKGSMELAREMIHTACIYCKADVVKFQKRNTRELLTDIEYAAPHPNPTHSYGDTYGQHRDALEFTIEQHAELLDLCESMGITYSCSVWDMTSTREIVQLNPDMIKIPSAANLKLDQLGYLCEMYPGEIHVSLGMTTHEEERRIVQFVTERERTQDLALYSCTSGYPVAFEDVCLREITRLYGYDVKGIGFSGHHLGIAADIAAMTLGAEWIERHFTLDRTWRGTDHAASLEPDGMRKLVRDVRNVSTALSYKDKEILDVEQTQRDKLKKR